MYGGFYALFIGYGNSCSRCRLYRLNVDIARLLCGSVCRRSCVVCRFGRGTRVCGSFVRVACGGIGCGCCIACGSYGAVNLAESVHKSVKLVGACGCVFIKSRPLHINIENLRAQESLALIKSDFGNRHACGCECLRCQLDNDNAVFYGCVIEYGMPVSFGKLQAGRYSVLDSVSLPAIKRGNFKKTGFCVVLLCKYRNRVRISAKIERKFLPNFHR